MVMSLSPCLWTRPNLHWGRDLNSWGHFYGFTCGVYVLGLVPVLLSRCSHRIAQGPAFFHYIPVPVVLEKVPFFSAMPITQGHFPDFVMQFFLHLFMDHTHATATIRVALIAVKDPLQVGFGVVCEGRDMDLLCRGFFIECLPFQKVLNLSSVAYSLELRQSLVNF